MEFTWDPEKAASNIKKHGVDFADAVGVFYDELALTVADDHPDEERLITVGSDSLGRIVLVVYCWRDERIRIISARRATRQERRQYEEEQS